MVFSLTTNLKPEQKIDSLNSSREIVGNWTLKEGWFPEQDLKFEKSSKDNAYMTFKFNANGTIEYLYELQGDCDVGEFTMRDGKWSISGDFLTIEMRGLKISDYWYCKQPPNPIFSSCATRCIFVKNFDLCNEPKIPCSL